MVARSIVAALLLLASSLPSPALGQGSSELASWLAGPQRQLLTEQEWSLIDTLRGPAETERFIEWFWKRRDPVPDSYVNEFRREFELRVDLADRRFGRPPEVSGWDTGPGLVQLVMGEPRQVSRGPAVYFAGEFRDSVVWTYPNPRDTAKRAQFYFIDTGAGVLELAIDDDVPASRQQLAWLDVARREIVLDDSRFATVARDISVTPLPATGVATRAGRGVLVRVTLPVTGLFGAPVGDGILYSLDVALDANGQSRRLGLAQIRLSLEEIRESRDRTMEIIGWVPLTGTDDVSIRITEMPSRRQISVVASPNEASPEVFEIARELCLTELMQGEGTLVAFFGADEASRSIVALLHVGTEQAGAMNIVPGSPLWIERIGGMGSPQPR